MLQCAQAGQIITYLKIVDSEVKMSNTVVHVTSQRRLESAFSRSSHFPESPGAGLSFNNVLQACRQCCAGGGSLSVGSWLLS